MKIWSIDWLSFEWSISGGRTSYVPDEYGTYGDFYMICVLGLYIVIDLRPVGGRKHKELMELIEILADVEHVQWAHWQKYLHSKCTANRNGDLLIPTELVRRWERQLNTPYADLTEDEKESDREEAKRVLESLRSYKYFFKMKGGKK